MATELVVMGEDTNVSLWRNPETVLTEAKQAAQALIKVVNMKPKKVVFNGETYLEFEDWQTVSKFYGCTTKIISTNLVEFDGVRGFEATAVVLDRHQNEIGRVDSMCLSDEANWGDVPVYEWKDELDEKGQKIWIERNGKRVPKAKKVEVSRAPKPLFQLRSMAQTRAQVKALRSIFSWVVVMAGYQPTPAEELTGNEFPEDEQEQKKPVPMPTEKKAEPEKKTEKFEASGIITARGNGKDNALWLTLKEQILAVPADKVGLHPFGVGDTLTFTAIEKQGKERKFWVLQSVESYTVADTIPPMPDGSAPPKVPDAMDKAIAEGKFDEPIGTLEETRTNRVGEKRQIRLWTLMTTNAKKTGLTREIVHKILDAMEPPVKHLADLDMSFYTKFEDLMTGMEDWRPLVD